MNVGAEKVLHLDGALGRQFVKRAVDMGPEGYAVFGNGAELAERHDLISAGVGQDRPLPAHEAVQAAKPRDPLGAGPQHEVISVAENDVRARRFDIVEEHGLDRGRGANGHESRRADGAARRRNLAEAGAAVIREKLEGEGRGHSVGPSARRSRHASP